jgi:serine/threonine protein phosphatase PrpC
MGYCYVAAARTDIGITKDVNQDSLTLKVANTALGEAVIAVLCDGMGGLKQGEVASAVVVRAFEQWFISELTGKLMFGFRADDIKNAWNDIAIECNGKIAEYSRQRFAGHKNAYMGTTLTVMLIVDGCYYISHVGDCRVYVMNCDGIKQVTFDQTFVAREVSLGHMTPEQARNDSRRNVILQCIGTGREVVPDFIYGKVYVGDSFLLCSDGFRHEVSDSEIYEYCHDRLCGVNWEGNTREGNSEIMGRQLKTLIEMNKKRGEHDNISAMLIKVLKS